MRKEIKKMLYCFCFVLVSLLLGAASGGIVYGICLLINIKALAVMGFITVSVVTAIFYFTMVMKEWF